MIVKPVLLLLSVGSLVGRNVIDALGERRKRIRIVATNSDPSAPILSDCDVVDIVPQTRGNEALVERRVAQLCEHYRPSLVIPCRDDDVLLLASLADSAGVESSSFLVGGRQAAESTCDALASARFSEEFGLPFASSANGDDAQGIARLVLSCGFPLVVKPRRGFASRGVRIVENADQLARVTARGGVIVQGYLGSKAEFQACREESRWLGEPLFHSHEQIKVSLQAMVSPSGEVLSFFATEHRMNQGMSMHVTPCEAADAHRLARLCGEAFARAGWRGPLNAQCHRDDSGQLGIFEFNGRFTGATAARTWLGYDEVGIAFEAFAGIPMSRGGGVLRAVGARKILSNVPIYPERGGASGSPRTR